MTAFIPKRSQGFTLIEMIVVIIILGVLAVGISNFLKFGSRIYVETSERDQLVSAARFAVERLNRELRHALPNSARLIGNSNQCIEFRSIKAVTIYTDIPVAPEASSDQVSLIRFDDSQFNTGLSVAVYPLYPDEVYGVTAKVREISSLTNIGNEWTLTLDSAHLFPEDSPTHRLYFIDQPTSFCLLGQSLYRHYGYNGYNLSGIPNNLGVLMAENLAATSQFQVLSASQNRNGQVKVLLTFSQNAETVSFNNEIQVPNVP